MKYKYLRCAKSPQVVEKYFPKILEDDIVSNSHEFMEICNFIVKYANDDTIYILLQYYINNFDLLQER